MNDFDLGKVEGFRLPLLDLVDSLRRLLPFAEVNEVANIVGSAILDEGESGEICSYMHSRCHFR